VASPLGGRYITAKSLEKLVIMVTSQSHKIGQLKWFYSALTGVCAAYFFALFSGQVSITESKYLQVSTLLFAMCLPLFATFSLVHIFFIEANLPADVCDAALRQSWVTRLTKVVIFMFIAAFGSLIGHFSMVALFGAATVSICCIVSVMVFINQVNKKLREK
ncbi:hypothetical protein ACUT7C_003693, partial [Vibrio cholerae]